MTETSAHTRQRVAAIVGGSSGSTALLAAAEAIGRGLVEAGFCIATGGRTGVMEAASRGGRQAERWTPGRVIALLPTLDADHANPYADVVIPTGLQFARNTLVVASGDVVVAIGGGAGTMSEIALAWQHDKPIVALDIGEGWSAKLAGERLDHRRDDVIHRATTAKEAVELAIGLAGSRPAPKGFAG